jgi:hypothetical protein
MEDVILFSETFASLQFSPQDLLVDVVDLRVVPGGDVVGPEGAG